MTEILQTELFDKLIPFITWISKPKQRITFELTANFLISEKAMQSFVRDWEHEFVRWPGKPTSYGAITPGPVKHQLLTVSFTDRTVFDYMLDAACRAIRSGIMENFHAGLNIDLGEMQPPHFLHFIAVPLLTPCQKHLQGS